MELSGKLKKLKELISLLYNEHLSQYGKRKLEAYISNIQKELNKKDKVIDEMAKMICRYDSQLVINSFDNIEDVKELVFKKVEEE